MTDLDNLYQREYQPMVRLARLLTGSLATAEELVQDAFITLHQRADRIDNPGGYLRRTVVNNCYSHLRRADLERRKLQVVGNRPDHPELPTDLDETWRSLESLKPRQRTALVLRFYEDLSVADVAELMGVREGTVKSLVHRGLRQLEKELSR